MTTRVATVTGHRWSRHAQAHPLCRRDRRPWPAAGHREFPATAPGYGALQSWLRGHGAPRLDWGGKHRIIRRALARFLTTPVSM